HGRLLGVIDRKNRDFGTENKIVQNKILTFEYFKKAVEVGVGHVQAYSQLGDCYRNGFG
ncbi:24631_t:CDS:1, partial [Gigaspora rosea]